MKKMLLVTSDRLVAARILTMLVALVLTVHGAKAQMNSGGPWSQDALAPVPDTEEGQPINSSQTPDAVLDYVDHAVQPRLRVVAATAHVEGQVLVVTSNARLEFAPGLDAQLIPVVAQFGVTNLLAAIQKGASVQSGDLSDAMVGEVKNFEEMIFMRSLTAAATSKDIPALIDAVNNEDADKKNAGLMQLILQRQEWANDPRVAEFVSEQLDSTKGNDVVGDFLFKYAVASQDPKVQAKMANILQGMIGDPSGNRLDGMVENSSNNRRTGSSGPEVSLDQLMFDALKAQNQPCIALLPAWVSARMDAWLKDPDGRENGVRGIAAVLLYNPEYLAEAPVKEAVTSVMSSISSVPAYAADYDLFAAVQGDKHAFEELATAGDLKRPSSEPVTLNGNSISDVMAKNFAYDYLSRVAFRSHLQMNDMTKVLSELDQGVYYNGQWTVPGPPGQPTPTPPPALAAQPAATAPATTPSPAPATASPPAPITSQRVAAVPAPPTPPAPKTGVVTAATKIETQTPSGGHAAIPLDVGTPLTILSVNADGTDTAQTSFGFKGNVPQSAIRIGN